MPDDDFKIDIRHFPFLDRPTNRAIALQTRDADGRSFSEEELAALRQSCRGIMRGAITESISLEEFQALRCLRAVEGYVDLGMFEEAEEELRELDPAWFYLEATLSLQLRVLAGLNHSE
ncbi:MAG TPA: hypothetical protein VH170_02055 [Chthoniobacterales bacterium]|jgi:hypothetical protein|nr:hypothetical protein [Chthoniobacterales bacterium]